MPDLAVLRATEKVVVKEESLPSAAKAGFIAKQLCTD